MLQVKTFMLETPIYKQALRFYLLAVQNYNNANTACELYKRYFLALAALF